LDVEEVTVVAAAVAVVPLAVRRERRMSGCLSPSSDVS
jgi:hypothetical protein